MPTVWQVMFEASGDLLDERGDGRAAMAGPARSRPKGIPHRPAARPALLERARTDRRGSAGPDHRHGQADSTRRGPDIRTLDPGRTAGRVPLRRRQPGRENGWRLVVITGAPRSGSFATPRSRWPSFPSTRPVCRFQPGWEMAADGESPLQALDDRHLGPSPGARRYGALLLPGQPADRGPGCEPGHAPVEVETGW